MISPCVFVLEIKIKQVFPVGPHEVSVFIEPTLGHL